MSAHHWRTGKQTLQLLLDNRSFTIRSYSDETIAAEKLEALVYLGTVTSRYKDFYDLYALLVKADLTDDKVVTAACNTFKNRNTALPELPESIAEAYWASDSFNTDWQLKSAGAIEGFWG